MYGGLTSAGFVTANVRWIPSGMNQADRDTSQRLIILMKKKNTDLFIKIESLTELSSRRLAVNKSLYVDPKELCIHQQC